MSPGQNHFELLGLEPRPDLDPDELELRYLRASRKVHPDRAPAGEEAAYSARSERLNEAFRVLADPWKRLPYLAELQAPCILEQTAHMSPEFLARAMELGERVDDARQHPGHRDRLEAELRAELDELRRRVEALLAETGRAAQAARLCHEARYHQRALDNLCRRTPTAR